MRRNSRDFSEGLHCISMHQRTVGLGKGYDFTQRLDDSRETIAREIGVIAPMISFTSGGSEANNLAIKNAPVERLLISAIEHPAVIESAKAAYKPAELIPVTSQGVVDLEALANLLEGVPSPEPEPAGDGVPATPVGTPPPLPGDVPGLALAGGAGVSPPVPGDGGGGVGVGSMAGKRRRSTTS